PEDLRGRVIHGLNALRERLRQADPPPEPTRTALQPDYLANLARYVTRRLRASNILDLERDYIPRTLRAAGAAGSAALSWRELLEAHAGAILRASAGAGKSTS